MRRADAFGMFGHGIDQALAHLTNKVRFPVIAAPERLAGVEHGLMRDERLHCDGIGNRFAEGLERTHRILSVGGIAVPARGVKPATPVLDTMPLGTTSPRGCAS